MQIDASGFIPSKISCQNPVQCYILMYITTARPSSLSLFSLRSFFLVIFPNLYNCNHFPASGKTLRCKLTLRYESMLFAHWRSGQKERLLSVCSTKFKTVKKVFGEIEHIKKNWINEAQSSNKQGRKRNSYPAHYMKGKKEKEEEEREREEKPDRSERQNTKDGEKGRVRIHIE